MSEAESFFVRHGDAVVATVLTQGAWDPKQQHGGLVQALLATTVESVPTLAPMQLTRLTVDMVRPVPIGERLHLSTHILREGKKIQVVAVEIRTVDALHARATALRIRAEDMAGRTTVPVTTVEHERVLPRPDDVAVMTIPKRAGVRPGFLGGVEMRPIPSGFWLRLKVPLFPGEPAAPIARLMVAADMVNTIGVQIDPTSFTTINPDMNVHVLRPPRSEWVSVFGDTRFQLDAGLGVSNGILGDLDGVCAVAGTSQLVQVR